jgi:NTE family protein
MTIPFLSEPRIADCLESCRAFASELGPDRRPGWKDHQSSELRYVNLILQGGGTLGIAHLGVIAGLEAAGIRFSGLAGTSAGAIVAILIAAARKDWNQPVAERIAPILAAMPMEEFSDGVPAVSRVVGALTSEKPRIGASMLPDFLSSLNQLRTNFGLNPGEHFERWLRTTLQNEFSIVNDEDLLNRLDQGPDWLSADGGAPTHGDDLKRRSRLRLFATAIPGGIKFCFPEMRKLLLDDSHSSSPSFWARSSMSVPLYFVPVQSRISGSGWQRLVATMEGLVSPEHTEPWKLTTEVWFVDGGLLSNFPTDAFSTDLVWVDRDGAPPRCIGTDFWGAYARLPTLGISFQAKPEPTDMRDWRGVSGLIKLFGNTADGARQLRDREALMRSRFSTVSPTDAIFADITGFNWLDFAMSEASQRELFLRGAKAAEAFLSNRVTREMRHDRAIP